MTPTAARWVVLTAAIVASAVTARLGVWQLDRADEKLRHQALREQRARMPALPMVELASDVAGVAAQVGRRVTVSGTWIAASTVYLENRTMAGRVGFFVVTPLLIDDGRLVAVQRGWLARDAADRTRIAPYLTPDGRVSLSGHIAPSASRLYQLGDPGTGPIRQNLDLDAYGRALRRPLVPLVVVQDDETSSPTSDGLLRQWPQPATDVYKHHGYAFQWFGLSALVVILYVWFQLIRPRRRAHP